MAWEAALLAARWKYFVTPRTKARGQMSNDAPILDRTAKASLFRRTQKGATMRKLIFASTLGLLASCTTAPTLQSPVPVELAQGEMVELWGVSAGWTTDGVFVSGNAKKRLIPNRPLNEHLHAEAIGTDGRVLEPRDVAWNSIVSLRARNSASFQTKFDAHVSKSISRIRMAVVGGILHGDT